MNRLDEKALLHLTGKSSLNQVSVEELENICNEHPYFPVARLLFSKKLKIEQSERFTTEVQKTVLYFPNTYWLHFQLMTEQPEISLQNNDPEEIAATVSEQKEKSKKAYEQLRSVRNEPLPQAETIEIANELPSVAMTDEKIAESNGHAAEPGIAEDILPGEPNEDIENTGNGITEITPEEDTAGEMTMPDEFHPEMEEVLEDIQQQEADKETRQEIPGTTHPAEEVYIKDNEEPLEQSTAEQSSPQVPSTKNTSPANDESAPVVPIEPYFTVDYFASQGIKLLLEKYPKDKLGQQLRSFTDWLRYMKKIGPENSAPTSEEAQMESAIQKIADTSNIPREVITETMAEVLEKQGKKEQAIQLYRKLSFLDPGKSAYFAGKIQKLNDT